MKKISMILFDLDGTLLNSEYYILDKTKDEIRQLKTLGIEIVLCSGRYPGMMKLYMNETKADWMIAMNGAWIQSSKGNILRDKAIDFNTAKFIIEKCDQYQLSYIIQNNQDIYFSKCNPRTFMVQRYNELAFKAKMSELSIEPLRVIPKRIHKIIILDKKEENMLMNELKQLPITVTASASHLIEVTASSVCKGNAALSLAEACVVEPECICAFGDSENDISLFESVGIKYAMKNSDSRLIKLADAVIGTNDEECIANILAKIREGCL